MIHFFNHWRVEEYYIRFTSFYQLFNFFSQNLDIVVVWIFDSWFNPKRIYLICEASFCATALKKEKNAQNVIFTLNMKVHAFFSPYNLLHKKCKYFKY